VLTSFIALCVFCVFSSEILGLLHSIKHHCTREFTGVLVIIVPYRAYIVFHQKSVKMNSISEVTPLFIKNRDFPERMTEFAVCSLIAGHVDPTDLLGCQRIGELWRIYFKTNNSALLSRELIFNEKTIPVYKHNPFRTGAESPDETPIRITVKDLPLSVHNRSLEEYLKREGVEISSKIEYGRARDPDTRQLTDWYNGDRIIYAKTLKTNLPRFINIGNFACRVFHEGQETKPMMCTNCFQSGHTRGRCTAPKACKACKKPGHLAGTETCEAFLSKAPKVVIIDNELDPLATTYPCEVKVMGLTFNSTEQAYQYSKAIRRGQPDVANEILKSPTPQLARSKTKFLKVDKNWNREEKKKLMKQILEAQAEQTPAFREALLTSSRQSIVYASPFEYEWASGMTTQETLHTKKANWPGKNLLGQLLQDIRTQLIPKQSSKDRTSSTKST
jgi:hypothetical protein